MPRGINRSEREKQRFLHEIEKLANVSFSGAFFRRKVAKLICYFRSVSLFSHLTESKKSQAIEKIRIKFEMWDFLKLCRQ
jgi:hypothetical protein